MQLLCLFSNLYHSIWPNLDYLQIIRTKTPYGVMLLFQCSLSTVLNDFEKLFHSLYLNLQFPHFDFQLSHLLLFFCSHNYKYDKQRILISIDNKLFIKWWFILFACCQFLQRLLLIIHSFKQKKCIRYS